MRILLSIKPEHVYNILSGVKTFEFRRRIFLRRDITTVLIYCTMPVGRFIGEFDIANILEDKPMQLWQKTKHGAGVSQTSFNSYFAGREKAYALEIFNLRVFKKPIIPHDVLKNFKAPQSYMYVGGSGEVIYR